MANDLSLNPNIFTVDTLNNPMSLEIDSEDINEATTYSLKVKVEYNNYPSVSSFINFDVIIEDNCSNDATSTASSTVISH